MFFMVCFVVTHTPNYGKCIKNHSYSNELGTLESNFQLFIIWKKGGSATNTFSQSSTEQQQNKNNNNFYNIHILHDNDG